MDTNAHAQETIREWQERHKSELTKRQNLEAELRTEKDKQKQVSASESLKIRQLKVDLAQAHTAVNNEQIVRLNAETELQAAQGKLAVSQQNHAKTEREVKNLQRALEESKKECRDAKAEKHSFWIESPESMGSNRGVELEKQKSLVEELRNQLSDEQHAKTAAVNTLHKRNKQLDELRTKLEAKESAKANLEIRLSGERSAKKMMEDKLCAEASAKTAYGDQLSAERSARSAVEEKVQQLVEKLKSEELRAQDVTKALEEQKSRIDEMKKELLAATTAKTVAESKFQALTQRLKNASAELNKGKEERKSEKGTWASEILRKEEVASALKTQLAESERKLDETTAKATAQAEEKDALALQLRQVISTMESQRVAAQETRQRLEEQVRTLNTLQNETTLVLKDYVHNSAKAGFLADPPEQTLYRTLLRLRRISGAFKRNAAFAELVSDVLVSEAEEKEDFISAVRKTREEVDAANDGDVEKWIKMGVEVDIAARKNDAAGVIEGREQVRVKDGVAAWVSG